MEGRGRGSSVRPSFDDSRLHPSKKSKRRRRSEERGGRMRSAIKAFSLSLSYRGGGGGGPRGSSVREGPFAAGGGRGCVWRERRRPDSRESRKGESRESSPPLFFLLEEGRGIVPPDSFSSVAIIPSQIKVSQRKKDHPSSLLPPPLFPLFFFTPSQS